jgi:hypothetical protein
MQRRFYATDCYRVTRQYASDHDLSVRSSEALDYLGTS